MTSHLALYRKYRPTDFSGVRGQDHIVQALSQASARGDVAHAYLFAGSRGTGKTSLARIFAQSLGTTHRDLYEIDAASNRGVDDVRALREEVNNVPFESRYKVYIIDEVHMLTKEAFNALLKTLEEPPRHVVFILATTELDRLPDTVISRCQVYRFARPTIAVLKDLIKAVAQEEGRVLDESSIDLIAHLGDGSFRDTLGVLEKALTSGASEPLTLDDVRRSLGVPTSDHVFALVDALAQHDAEAALSAVSDAQKANVDPKALLAMLIRIVRAVLLMRSAPRLKPVLADELSERELELVTHHAKHSAARVHSKLLARLLEAELAKQSTPIASLPLELAVIDSTT